MVLVEFENRPVTHGTGARMGPGRSPASATQSRRAEAGNFHGRDWCATEYAEEIIRSAQDLPRSVSREKHERSVLVRGNFACAAAVERSCSGRVVLLVDESSPKRQRSRSDTSWGQELELLEIQRRALRARLNSFAERADCKFTPLTRLLSSREFQNAQRVM